MKKTILLALIVAVVCLEVNRNFLQHEEPENTQNTSRQSIETGQVVFQGIINQYPEPSRDRFISVSELALIRTARLPRPSDLPNFPDRPQPYVRGKVLVIDAINKVVDRLHSELPNELRPSKPEEIGTLAYIQCNELEHVGRYYPSGEMEIGRPLRLGSPGDPAVRRLCTLTLVVRDRAAGYHAGLIFEKQVFRGSNPPQQIHSKNVLKDNEIVEDRELATKGYMLEEQLKRESDPRKRIELEIEFEEFLDDLRLGNSSLLPTLVTNLGDWEQKANVGPAPSGEVVRYIKVLPRKDMIPRTVSALIEAITNGNQEIKAEAIWQLGDMRDSATIDTLVSAMGDQDQSVRSEAVWALAKIKDIRASEAIVAALNDSEYFVREDAAWALALTRAPQAATALAKTLATMPNELWGSYTRLELTNLLGRIADPVVIDVLIRILQTDSNSMVRAAAAEALGKIGDPRSIESLANVDPGNSGDIRISVARALSRLKGDDIESELFKEHIRDMRLFGTLPAEGSASQRRY